MIDCVIFDFDGTIADTQNATLDIYNLLASKYGYKVFEGARFEELRHMSWADLISETKVPVAKIPYLLREGQKILSNYIKAINPIHDDFQSIFERIRGEVKTVGVISSNTKGNIEAFFEGHGIEKPAFILCSPIFSKAEKIVYALKRYRLKSRNTIYVGDEIRDAEASKKAGVRCVCVSWGYNAPDVLLKAAPAFLVDDMSEILAIITEENDKYKIKMT